VQLIFTRYLFAFELTSALLITAALGAMVLAYAQTQAHAKRGQRQTVQARLRASTRASPAARPRRVRHGELRGRARAAADGSIAPESLAEIIDRTEVTVRPQPAAGATTRTR
jgi:NADH-quinone oxidoreductase subunit J